MGNINKRLHKWIISSALAGLRRGAAALPLLLGRDRQLGKQKHPQFPGGLGRAAGARLVWGHWRVMGLIWTCAAHSGTAPTWPRAAPLGHLLHLQGEHRQGHTSQNVSVLDLGLPCEQVSG